MSDTDRTTDNSFSLRLRECRKNKGISQKELASLSGVSLRSVINYESGERYPGSLLTVKSLSSALGVSAEFLLDDESSYIIEANQKGGSRDGRKLQSILAEVGGLFAGGEMSEDDKDRVMRTINEMYWMAKESNKKYAPKKTRGI